MHKRIILAISVLIFFSCFSQSRPPHKGYVFIQELKKDGQIHLGTIFGLPLSKDVFTKIIIVRRNGAKYKTLYTIDKTGFYNTKGLDMSAAGEDYDGYMIDFLESNRFGVYLFKKDGASSDGAIIIWNDSLKVFETIKIP
jgi:hypothetical protein